jgi:FMN phosphatase YigB (HAD superfamily)
MVVSQAGQKSEWLIDFDDTLATGPINWAFEKTIPTFVRDRQLPFNAAVFAKVTIESQKLANQPNKEDEALAVVFDAMGWPEDLKKPLLDAVFGDYKTTLFPDAIPFLLRGQSAGHRLYIVSNNPYAPQLAVELGISQYVLDVFTPKKLGLRGKPERDLWTYMIDAGLTKAASAVMIGDDPWSDGLFAQHGPFPCWIVDRLHRYADVPPGEMRFVASLDAIG